MLKQAFTLFLLHLFTLQTNSLTILLPLYTSPGPSASAWKPIIATIKANPHVQFQVIVNPSDGPGTSHYPTPPYIAGLTLLNTLPNALTLGYVNTTYARRPITAANADIDTYANWASFSDSNIAVHGIFFDQVPTTAAQDALHYVERLSDYARHHDHAIPAVVCNPGAIAPAKLFAYCDTVVEFEDTFKKYETGFNYNELPGSSRLRGQTAIVATRTPATADVKGVVGKMAAEGIGAVYFSGDASYQTVSPTLLQKMVDAVAPQRSRIQGKLEAGAGELR